MKKLLLIALFCTIGSLINAWLYDPQSGVEEVRAPRAGMLSRSAMTVVDPEASTSYRAPGFLAGRSAMRSAAHPEAQGAAKGYHARSRAK